MSQGISISRFGLCEHHCKTMNHDDLERRLRSLKPTAVVYRQPEKRPNRRYRLYWLAIPVAAAASLLVLVFFAPETAKNAAETPSVIVVDTDVPDLKFSTVRQLSHEMLLELQLAKKTADGSQQTAGNVEYPVIKLAVSAGKYVPAPPRLEGIFHSRSEVNLDL